MEKAMEIFSETDRDLLECLASGWGLVDIAVELGLPYHQAMRDIDNLKVKLGASADTPDYIFSRKLKNLIAGFSS